MKYDRFGRSEDETLLMAIGRPTAGADASYSYSKWWKSVFKNKCAVCGAEKTLYWSQQEASGYNEASGRNEPTSIEGSIFCRACDADFSCVSGHEHMSRNNILERVSGPEETTEEELAKLKNGEMSDSSSGSSSSQQDPNVSPLLVGEMSYEELIGEICNGIDLLFLCKRTHPVCTDFETIFAEAYELREKHPEAVDEEDIRIWQIEDGSYELDIDEYGFYNTVHVKWAHGTVTEDFEDLVRVFGKVEITYTEPNITSKSLAIKKAKSYLAAHLREFDMEVKTTAMGTLGIDVGDIVTIDNPLTLRDTNKKANDETQEFLFVSGYSADWDEGMLKYDLDLKYAPESPERKEIPEIGAGGYSGSASGGSEGGYKKSKCGDGSMTWDECWEIAHSWVYGGWGSNHDPQKAWNVMGKTKGHSADCYDATAWLFYALNFKAGFICQDICNRSSSAPSGSHHYIKCQNDSGEFVVPDEMRNMNRGLNANSNSAGEIVSREPPTGDCQTPAYTGCPYARSGFD